MTEERRPRWVPSSHIVDPGDTAYITDPPRKRVSPTAATDWEIVASLPRGPEIHSAIGRIIAQKEYRSFRMGEIITDMHGDVQLEPEVFKEIAGSVNQFPGLRKHQGIYIVDRVIERNDI